ncbi:MAG TPA: SDR family oxidoreductase [Pseudolysinimonas sp.]|nr:SDR family oxidoreductase [Pseudolysinimonas sp.]
MDLALTGRRVIVSGAASGIGRACAHAFAAEGARVAVLDRDAAGVAGVVAGLPGAIGTVADVTDGEALRSAVTGAAAELGGLDHVVACAGISGPFGVPLTEIRRDDWDAVFAVNVTGAFQLVQAALPALRAAERPTIVMLSSDSAVVAAAGMVPYCASKGAVLQLARALAVELAPEGIRVNAICPSIVDTPMSRRDLGLEDAGFAGAGFPVQTPDEVAAHVLYLSSAVSRPVNGVAMLSDFGYAAQSSFPA